jgi:hypothetical protein
VNVDDLQPRPPAGWDAETFEKVAAALAEALVGAYRRAKAENDEQERPA